MKQVSMTVTYTAETAQRTHRHIMRDDTISRTELLVWGPILGGTTLSWFDGDEAAVESLLGRVDNVSNFHLVPSDDGTYAFTERSEYEFDSDVLSLISDVRIVFIPPLTYFDTGELRFAAVGEQSDLSEFFNDLSALVDVQLEQLYTFHPRHSFASITDHQRQALVAAVEVGYYEVPRSGSIDDIASVLGCAHSTAGELLRKAESAVISESVAPGRGATEWR